MGWSKGPPPPIDVKRAFIQIPIRNCYITIYRGIKTFHDSRQIYSENHDENV